MNLGTLINIFLCLVILGLVYYIAKVKSGQPAPTLPSDAIAEQATTQAVASQVVSTVFLGL